jgi:large subunit ribosomal protein L13
VPGAFDAPAFPQVASLIGRTANPVGRPFFAMKTYAPKPKDIERRWYVIDADGVVLGRLATEVAQILRGKHKPIYAPHADTGDHVVVINAQGVRLTGDKAEQKIEYRHSGYPGGLTETKYGRLMGERPSYVVEKAIKGMLPHNSLGRSMFSKLQVYDGPEHPHAAQRPEALKLGEIPKWTGLPVPAPQPVAKPKTKPQATAAKTAAAPKAAASTTAAAKKPATARKPATAAKTTAKRSTAKKAATAKPAAKKPSRRAAKKDTK